MSLASFVDFKEQVITPELLQRGVVAPIDQPIGYNVVLDLPQPERARVSIMRWFGPNAAVCLRNMTVRGGAEASQRKAGCGVVGHAYRLA